MPGCECSLLFVVSREGGVYKSEGLVWLQQRGNKAKTERALGLQPRGRWGGRTGGAQKKGRSYLVFACEFIGRGMGRNGED